MVLCSCIDFTIVEIRLWNHPLNDNAFQHVCAIYRMLSQFCFISHYYSNEYGETPVDSAYRSGEQKMIELMDKDGLLPRDDDPKLPSRICDVRYSNEQ